MNDLEMQQIESFIKKEKDYFKFYRNPVSKITVFLIFSNTNNEIIRIKKIKKCLQNGVFNKNMFFSIIQNYKNHENKKYRFDSCNQYNFNILPENVENYVNKENVDDYYFMNTVYSIEDIYFEDTIEIFESLNCLYFLFKEQKRTNTTTKRVYIKENNRKTRKINNNKKNMLDFLSELDD